ncbi:MAG: hypothetical protein MJE68_25745 [Proteobacteria bacterium]|nr:hypothetical protein [Pseudomonadota bacterium]
MLSDGNKLNGSMPQSEKKGVITVYITVKILENVAKGKSRRKEKKYLDAEILKYVVAAAAQCAVGNQKRNAVILG